MAYAQYCIHDLSHRRTDGVNKHFIITGHKTLADDFVACILSEEKHDFLAGHNIVQEYGRDVIHDEPYTPEKLELCVARCDRGKWHRAEYQGSHEGISVLYDFDFGRIFEAKDSEIRVSKIHFLQFKLFVCYCYVLLQPKFIESANCSNTKNSQ